MNREQWVAKAARAIADHYEHPAGQYFSDAERVVDALLPQVTTVEELEALDWDVWLASGGVHPSKALRRALYWSRYDFDAFGPLTVVWSPS